MSALAAYEAALLEGADCWVHDGPRAPRVLPVRLWSADAGPHDDAVLGAAAHAGGPVLDVGCGPGRLTAALAARMVPALGIDVSAAAVALTRARGAVALRRDVFAALPAESSWSAVLLADGNIGIGGDPVALLRRCAALLSPGGVVVADLSADEPGLRRSVVRLHVDGADGRVGGALPWATVGVGAARELGRWAGLTVASLRSVGGTAVVVWTADPRQSGKGSGGAQPG